MIKKIINAIKIFFLGLLTGIITTIISYLYIKNQKVIKKIIKVKKNEKDSDNKPQINERQETDNMQKRGFVRQRNISSRRDR